MRIFRRKQKKDTQVISFSFLPFTEHGLEIIPGPGTTTWKDSHGVWVGLKEKDKPAGTGRQEDGE